MLFNLFSCQNQSNDQSIDGYWQCLGYGRYLDISDDTYSIYDYSELHCTPTVQFELSAMNEWLEVRNDTLIETIGLIKRYYKRLPELPRQCEEPMAEEKAKDPVFNFQVFAQTIREHYIYFDLNAIHWDTLYHRYAQQITNESTDLDVYKTCNLLLESLNDNHGYIEPSDHVYALYEQAQVERGNDESQGMVEYGDFQIADMVFDSFVETDLTKDSWLIKWGLVSDSIGYVQIKAMWLFADLELNDTLVKQDGFVSAYADAFVKLPESSYVQLEAEGANQIMKNVMNDLDSMSSIILDVRFNGGGQDVVSMEILKHFNDQPRQFASQYVRNGDSFSPVNQIILQADSTPFLQSVYILTSQQTASAADYFALASMVIPHVQRIGSHTQGALSTALEKYLPNGWYFSLSNEISRDLAGNLYENVGVPPDFELKYPGDRQEFFRWMADNLYPDRQRILSVIRE